MKPACILFSPTPDIQASGLFLSINPCLLLNAPYPGIFFQVILFFLLLSLSGMHDENLS